MKKAKSQKRVGWLRHFKVQDAVTYHGNMALGRDHGVVVAVRDARGAVVQWSPTRRGSVLVTDIIHSGECAHSQCKKAQGAEAAPQSEPQGQEQPQV